MKTKKKCRCGAIFGTLQCPIHSVDSKQDRLKEEIEKILDNDWLHREYVKALLSLFQKYEET